MVTSEDCASGKSKKSAANVGPTLYRAWAFASAVNVSAFQPLQLGCLNMCKREGPLGLALDVNLFILYGSYRLQHCRIR